MHLKRSTRSRFETRSVALFASLAAASGIACAQFSVGPAAPTKPAAVSNAAEQAFRKLDVNGDGGISRQEARASTNLVRAFDKADTDRNGVLSRAEFEKAAGM